MSYKFSAKLTAQEFLAELTEFQLGQLPTEQPHPKTANLSTLAHTDLVAACEILRDIEIEAVQKILQHESKLQSLANEIRSTFEAGHRVFFCGCGATGRLSLTIEALWRERYPEKAEQVVSFMAGGDYALIRSIENFEDFPDYGARQLRDLNFADGDLLVSTTEGGETPFVIGATEEAAKLSRRRPYFLYCNPDEILRQTALRSKRVLDNDQICKINLTVGPMALSGSTRLQATTVLMLAAGSALFSAEDNQPPIARVQDFLDVLKSLQFKDLIALIEWESDAYKNQDLLVHSTQDFAITVLTDTTERSPTFSLRPFNMQGEESEPSWTYLQIEGAENPEQAWQQVLKRPPRALDWEQLGGRFGINDVLRFDFSAGTFARRAQRWPDRAHDILRIQRVDKKIHFTTDRKTLSLPDPRDLLLSHLTVKVLLNIQSLLVMGRMGRYEGNLMLWVRSSNKKLIDRSIRYVLELLKKNDIKKQYEEVAHRLFAVLETAGAEEPIVLRTFESLLADEKGRK